MNTRNLLMMAAALIVVLACSGEAFARGGGGRGGAGGRDLRSQSRVPSQPRDCVNAQGQVRPADFQRRDGTFLQTGMTANGSTSRPAKGRRVMDGTGLNAAPAAE